jgi:hypothetical protein
MGFTDIIEKTIAGMFGARGVGLSRLYRKHYSFANACIVYLIGVFLYLTLSGLNIVIGIVVMLLWNWSMTIGPLGRLWDFGVTRTYVQPVTKVPDKWKKGEKKEVIEYREIEPNAEVVTTDAGIENADPAKHVVVRDASGKLSVMSKEEFRAKYDTNGA